jgi:hypothetical protein
MEIKDYPKYEKINESQKLKMVEEFIRYLGDFREILGENKEDLCICDYTMFEIIERIWKRKIYFQVFHNVNGLNELKESSLYCFWILKLQPFAWMNDKPNYELNALIALWLFTNGLKFYAAKVRKKVNLSKNIIENLYYSFRFRDLSKEAIMDLAEIMVF